MSKFRPHRQYELLPVIVFFNRGVHDFLHGSVYNKPGLAFDFIGQLTGSPSRLSDKKTKLEVCDSLVQNGLLDPIEITSHVQPLHHLCRIRDLPAGVQIVKV